MAYYEKNYNIIIENLKLLYKSAQKDKKSAINFEKVNENIIYNLDELKEGLNNLIESLLIDWAKEKRNILEIDKMSNEYNFGVAFWGDGGLWDITQKEVDFLKNKRLLKFEIEIDFEYSNIIINRDLTKLLREC